MEEGKLIRIRFKDAAMEEDFERDGYVVIKNMAAKEDVKQMLALFNRHYKAPEEKVVAWNTAAMLGEEEKNHISVELMKTLSLALNTYIEDYTPHFAYFLTKPAEKTATNISMHRDASAVDEKQSEYLIFWMPLIDLNENNGCLYIMPGSNKLFLYELPFAVDWPYKHLLKDLEAYKVDLKLSAGDAVIFSGKTLHGSYPNASDSPRPAVCCGLIDPVTQLLYYYYNRDNNTVETYEVGPDFFLHSDFSAPKGKYPLRSSFDYKPPVIQPKDIKSFYGKAGGLEKNGVNFFTRVKAMFA
jgi:ectoine hydroxylase-related dioxygenase (phytanoyl-CoA dioxygenase family)